MGLLSPALSARTPLLSLANWDLLMTCPKCGDRRKSVVDMFAAIDRCRPVGDVFPRLSCHACGSKPAKLIGMSRLNPLPVSEDWSFLLVAPEAMAA